MGTTATELEGAVRKLLEHFDSLDQDAIAALMAEDVQGVDEISRGWLRGKSALSDYFGKLKEMAVTDIKTSVSGFHTTTWGDAGLVTLMADQTYSVAGEHQHVVAPMTVAFRREGVGWKIVLVHAVPLPEHEE